MIIDKIKLSIIKLFIDYYTLIFHHSSLVVSYAPAREETAKCSLFPSGPYLYVSIL